MKSSIILALIILFLTSVSSKSAYPAVLTNKFPRSIPGQTSLLALLYSDLQIYMREVKKSSVVHYLNPNCREYHWKNDHQEVELKSCVERSVSANRIVEGVVFTVNNSPSVKFYLTREGKGVTPTPNENLLAFKFPLNVRRYNYRLSVEDLGLNINITNGQRSDKFLLTYTDTDYTVSITEYRGVKQSVRRYNVTCPSCSDDSNAKVIVRQNSAERIPQESVEVSYYADGINGKITPSLFNKAAMSLITFPLLKLSEALVEALHKKHHWPNPNQ